ncbi:pyrimidine reductase family protein [Kutzneria sp. CA-103260]|uniref:pyrimidine reductase family protein n=1 Tax=Kutzneria sp. CA-103260 TaxID=2802641 RepID=UPI001BABCFD7|nr:pyrimidine reductase family protein [Kutzneria sp. CA-103260]QUQ67454.1 5-amino-6-(5-phosphoribosylamino)uracil reductase [Kutzneria sp. CA-103260]
MLLPEARDIDDIELERLYDYPSELSRPWVQVNFVSSPDGAVTLGGKSQGLSGPADKKVFMLGRTLADVILVGAGTAAIEGYAGVQSGEVRAAVRARLGLAPVPPIAVVSRQATLDPASDLIASPLAPTIVFTCSAAPASRLEALSAAGAEVVITGDSDVNLSVALAELSRRRLHRVSCEGGPHLFGSLIEAGLVDQLCLTVSPRLAGGDASRIAVGPPPAAPLELDLASVLTDDGFLMLRYRSRRAG